LGSRSSISLREGRDTQAGPGRLQELYIMGHCFPSVRRAVRIAVQCLRIGHGAHDLGVLQLLALAAVAADRKNNHLAVTRRLRLCQTITRVSLNCDARMSLHSLTRSAGTTRTNTPQASANGRCAPERRVPCARFDFLRCPVKRRIQEQKGKRLDRNVHVEAAT